MSKIELEAVYVLHTRPFRNTSLIVELFSRLQGRVVAVAKSARGPQSRFRGQLQLFTPLLASWMGHHELKTLTHLELNGMPFQLNQTPLFSGFYLNELLMRLLHKEDPHPQLFDHYQQTLCFLEKNNAIPAVLRRFEKKLLDELGYGLSLFRDAKTHQAIQPQHYYQFIPDRGFLICDADTMQESELYFLGRDLLGIAEEQFDIDSVAIAAKKIMRVALSFLLGDVTLQSRMLF